MNEITVKATTADSIFNMTGFNFDMRLTDIDDKTTISFDCNKDFLKFATLVAEVESA